MDTDRDELRRIASAGLDTLREQTVALRLQLLRCAQAVEAVVGGSDDMLGRCEQELVSMLSAIAATQRQLDAKAAARRGFDAHVRRLFS